MIENETILTGLLVLGLLLKISGFMVRDELTLRSLVAAGIGCDALFYGLRAEPIIVSVAANLALVTINALLILLILTERTTWRMAPADAALLRHFTTLTPGQFRRLRRIMRIEDAAPGAVLTREAEPVPDLMLVLADRIVIGKQGAQFPITGPAFVGEIAFLTGAVSSADVILPDGGRVIRLPAAQVHARMARAPALHNAMVALFGRELARKVADSVPMDRAARQKGGAGPGDDDGKARGGTKAGALAPTGDAGDSQRPG